MGFAFDLLAIDLDGTLLNSQHELPPENRVALHRVHAAGVKIVLCTGRAFTEIASVLDQIGLELDAAVSVFGALVTEIATKKTLHRTAIAMETALAVTAWLQCREYPVLWLTDPNEAGDDGFVLAGQRRHPAVDEWMRRSPCRVTNVEQLPARCCAPVRLSIIDEDTVLDEISVDLHAEFDGRLTHNVLHAPPYRLSLIEAFAPEVNKWFAVEKLCRRWGIDPRRTVAFGDDVNDLDMIRGAGLGVAMANAKPAVRAAAARVTASNDEAGVARVIGELLGT